MGRRGPQPGPNTVPLETTVTPQIDAALNQLVELSGVSKATIVRNALHSFLSNLGVVYPELTTSLAPTPTAGRTRRATFTD